MAGTLPLVLPSHHLSARSVCFVQRHVPWDSAPARSGDLALPASSWDTWLFEEVQHQGAGGNLSVRCRTVPPVFSLVLFLCCPLLLTGREDHQIHLYVIQAGRCSAFLLCVWDVLNRMELTRQFLKKNGPWGLVVFAALSALSVKLLIVKTSDLWKNAELALRCL